MTDGFPTENQHRQNIRCIANRVVRNANKKVPSHLTTNPRSRIAPGLEVDPSRGLFYCTECRRRVTRNTENRCEYGHGRNCEYHQFSELECFAENYTKRTTGGGIQTNVLQQEREVVR